MNKKELRNLSKNELISIILELERRLEKLEHYHKVFDNAHTPPSKQLKENTENKDSNDKLRFPGKPKGGNGGGINLPEPDEIIEHKLDVCPISGLSLGEPVSFRKKTIIDFLNKPIKIIEHIIFQYISPATGEIIEPEVKLPKGIYGKNIQSITILLKNLTNSHEEIANFMRVLGAPSFSDTTVQNIADGYAIRLEPERNKFLEELRNSSCVHCDETGFRRDGHNGYIWGVFTKTISILQASLSRAKYNITNLLGKFPNVIVTDGYTGYNDFKLRQRCWAHLLRDFKYYAKDNIEIFVQYQRAKALYTKLKVLNEKPPNDDDIRKVNWEFNDIIRCLSTIKKARSLVTLIKNGEDDWFTALYYPDVPFENNLAERELRPIVLLRKAIGCYRNEKGKAWIENVVSVLHTWKLRNLNLFEQLRLIAN